MLLGSPILDTIDVSNEPPAPCTTDGSELNLPVRIVVLSSLLLVPPVFGQDPGDRLRFRTEPGSPWIESRYVSRGADSVTVSVEGINRVYELAALSETQRRARPSPYWILVPGLAFGLVVALEEEPDFRLTSSRGGDVALFFGGGLALGALVYVIWPFRRWKDFSFEALE